MAEGGIPFDTGFVSVPAIDPVTGQTVTLFNQRAETLGNNRQLLTNPSDFKTEFDGFEISAQRRFADGYQFLTSCRSTSDITRTSDVRERVRR